MVDAPQSITIFVDLESTTIYPKGSPAQPRASVPLATPTTTMSIKIGKKDVEEHKNKADALQMQLLHTKVDSKNKVADLERSLSALKLTVQKQEVQLMVVGRNEFLSSDEARLGL
ncbi:hypothetical protein ACH5RR_013364 [Cinchona calisaya]|uniref:Uncharacterized protein n=1 Tax=Cinchona calisaya TaxID=153742 RepID=A0ABD3A2G7_9GENT